MFTLKSVLPVKTFLSVALAAAVVSAPQECTRAYAAQGAQAVAAGLPTTPLGKAAGLLIAAINSGDPARTDAFVAEYLEHEKVQGGTPAEYRSLLRTVAEQSGGVDLVSVRPDPEPLRFVVRTKRGSHFAQVLMGGEPTLHGKLAGLGVAPAADPGAKPEPWPTARLTEARISEEVGRHAAAAASLDEFSGVVLVAKGDRVIFEKAYGFADKGLNVPNNASTKFHLGSIPKMWTAVLIAQLVEAGLLSFDDTVAKVLPEYPDKAAASKITVRHLLTHTSGLGGLFDRPGYDRRKRYATQADYFPVFAGAPLLFEPGERPSYSNEGFIVLGAIVEKLTGRDYLDVVRERVFEPAGMRATGAFALDEVTQNLAVGYGRFGDDPLGVAPRRPNWMFLGWRGNACGGSYSTASDLFRFARAFLADRYLRRETAGLLTGRGPMRNYGLGFDVREVNGRDVIGHSGGGLNSGINSDLKFFRDGSYTVAVVGNYDAPAASRLANQIVEFLSRQ